MTSTYCYNSLCLTNKTLEKRLEHTKSLAEYPKHGQSNYLDKLEASARNKVISAAKVAKTHFEQAQKTTDQLEQARHFFIGQSLFEAIPYMFATKSQGVPDILTEQASGFEQAAKFAQEGQEAKALESFFKAYHQKWAVESTLYSKHAPDKSEGSLFKQVANFCEQAATLAGQGELEKSKTSFEKAMQILKTYYKTESSKIEAESSKS